MTASATELQFFTDPSCPWAWITSRWITEVAPARNLSVRWRTFSIEERDGAELSPHIPAEIREIALAGRVVSRRAVRVFEAVRAKEGEEAVGRLYTELGHLIFPAGKPPVAPVPAVVRDALVASGLPAELAAEAEAAGWDAVVTESMREVFEAAGTGAMSPTILIGGKAVLGPMLTAVPDDSVRVWDDFTALLEHPEFVEFGRPRSFPVFPSDRR